MNDKTRGIAALILLTLVWGYSWVLIKLAVAKAGPFSLAAHRAFVASMALFAVLALLKRPLAPSRPGFLFLLGLVQTTFFLSVQGTALVTGGAGKTSVLVYTMPVWTLILSALFLGERIRASQAVAGALAMAGLLLIVSPWNLASSPLSQGLAIVAALLWSLGTLMVKRQSAKGPLDVLNLNAWQCFFGSVTLMPVAMLAPGPQVVWDGGYIGLVLSIGVLVTALGWALWSYVLKRLPAWQASLSVLGVPAVALLSSRLQTGEQVEPMEMSGIALIVAGLAFLSFLNWRVERALKR